MNQQKTAMQQLIDYIDLLDSKNLPEYTISVATRLKAIELLEDEFQQLKEAFEWEINLEFIELYDLKFEVYYNKKFNNNVNKI
jgi:hypothetical protein